ncbi:MAG TPA: D-alanyl-D-alanine carboxypeptidase family protein [Ktedonobacterales bacterium]
MSQRTRDPQPPRTEQARSGRAAFVWGLYLTLSTLVMVAALFQMSRVGAVFASQSGRALAAVAASGAVATPDLSGEPSVVAHAAFLFDADTGEILYSKNADEELPQASCTKIMTAMVAVEHGDLDQMITVGADARALVNSDSSYMGLSVGEKLTLRDLLYGLLLPSGNDAAVAIADGIAGSVPAFVALMNQKAAQLGLTRTHFENPHGLDAPGHYTTARDLAALAADAMRVPVIEQMTSTHSYNIPATATHKAYHLLTGNDLLTGSRAAYPGAIGVKPGYTGPAGYTMAFAAIRSGHLLVGSVLHDPSWQVRIVDMHTLLDWGFTHEGLPAAPPPPTPPAASLPSRLA